MTFASAPLLPVGDAIQGTVYRGYFVQSLQRALIQAGYPVGPAGADGLYGPATADALAAFQDDHPSEARADQLPGYLPYRVAGCRTYRALGLDVLTSYCRGGVSGDGAVCDEVMAADAQGFVSLKCVEAAGPVPPEEPETSDTFRRYVVPGLIGAGVALFGLLVWSSAQ